MTPKALLIVVMCAGCAPSLAIDSNPTGALVAQTTTGNQWVTPARLEFPNASTEGCFTVDPLVFTWPSGASTTSQPQVCNGAGSFVAQRPAGAPGLDVDVQAARERLMPTPTAATVVPAPVYQPRQQPGPQNCTSEVVGQTVFTRCR